MVGASFEPIAIIGQACVLPGALSPAAFVDAVFEGRDLTSEPPPGAWPFPPERAVSGPRTSGSLTLRGGYVTGFEQVFEADGFLVPADEITGLDPVFLWVLHCGREALAAAGLGPAPMERAGLVLANLSLPTRAFGELAHAWRTGRQTAADPRNRFMSGLPAHFAARALGLEAGAFALDAACASSLYALKLACDRLHDREADLMLAAAASAADWTHINRGFAALQALSPSGRSRPFHRDADGLLPAEGAACLVLKRLDDALAAQDPILAVIRGVGLSNDGRAAGFLAPSVEGQLVAMREAYHVAGLAPRDIGLIECHATGTPLGDAAEIASTARVFADLVAVPIGSHKSNLGHLLTAAGLAGVIKVIGAMARGQRPPTLHVDTPTNALAGTPLRLLRAAEPWAQDGPRRAAVSAFGFGGNNAHLLLEEPDAPRRRTALRVVRPRTAVAVVGIGAQVGAAADIGAFARALCDGATVEPRADEVVIPLERVRFPPRDLEQAIAQQTMLLAVAGEALAGVPGLALARTGVFIGMGCDPEATGVTVRLRLAHGDGPDPWRGAAADAVLPEVNVATILGRLPNIVANRLNASFDARGQSLTVSAEEHSGIVALELALRALAEGEIDAAIVGAVDLCHDPLHERAAAGVLPLERRPPGDAAVVLVLERATDAARNAHAILAEVRSGPAAGSAPCRLGDEGLSLTPRFGHAHAASGLLHVAAGVVLVNHDHGLDARGEAVPWAEDGSPPCVEIGMAALGAPARTVHLTAGAGQKAGVLLTRRREAPTAAFRVPAHSTLAPLPPRPREAAPALGADGAAIAARREALQLVSQSHRAFLAQQAEAHVAFAALMQRTMDPRRLVAGAPAPSTAPIPAPALHRPSQAPATPTPAPLHPGPKFDRRDLEVLASGKISAVFGPMFERQDGYRRQTRMPMPPLLLADRVTGIVGEPGSMGLGTMWTETDVRADEWYLHDGRIGAAVQIEAGQADLLLISWLGVDFRNRGERVYRLLGCDVTFLDSPAAVGDRLEFEIHVDGHANQGDVRLFFFHYDGTKNGRPMLKMRGGQAGFFTDEELAASAGVLWSAESAEPTAGARVDPPRRLPARASFDREHILALSEGRVFDCFGSGFEATASHVASPRIAGGRLRLFDRVTHFDPRGGPWGRGYLRALQIITPEDWFFTGHFLNDPCMPGTLMMEGAFQALAFYVVAVGYSLDKDGWRFEPVTDRSYHLRCRGQVIPTSRELVTEVFVDELWDGPTPTIVADILCTVDGLKAFHARRLAYRLVRDRPLSRVPLAPASHEDRRAVEVDGLVFGARTLLAASWGRSSEAFGPRFAALDERRVPRLPGPPLLFVSRVVHLPGPAAQLDAAHEIEAEYDIPRDAFYFSSNGAPTMPFAVLLEAALQPCGWLASYAGGPLTSAEPLSFRNLDGTGTVLAEVLPDSGTLTTRARLTKVFRNGATTIVAFEGACRIGDTPVYRFETVFGFFSDEALAAQVGLPPSPTEAAERAQAERERTPYDVDLSARPARFFAGPLRLPTPDLLMLDRITGYWPAGGRAGLGRMSAEKVVRPDEWFFKAHFFEDPVQPGSLGIEALIQLLEAFMIERDLGAGIHAPRFEALALAREHVWKYRGQVLPKNRLITTEITVTELGHDERGPYAVAEGALFVDGTRIYVVRGLALRIISDARADSSSRSAPTSIDEEISVDLASAPWLRDHAPTFARAALPLMDMVERAAQAAARLLPQRRIVAVEGLRVQRWAIVDQSARLRVRASLLDEHTADVRLELWRDAPGALARFEPLAQARVRTAASYPPAPPEVAPLSHAEPIDDPYRLDDVFHGPAYRVVSSSTIGDEGRTDRLRADSGVPVGLLNHVLLDAIFHGLAPRALARFAPGTRDDAVYLPAAVTALTLHQATPHAQTAGELTCHVRYVGHGDGLLHLHAQLVTTAGVWADIRCSLRAFFIPMARALPSGAIVRFMRDRLPVAGYGLSRTLGAQTRLTVHEAKAFDWFPGTLAHAYAIDAAAAGAPREVALQVAAKDHVARREHVHPSLVEVVARDVGSLVARVPSLPLTRYDLAARWEDGDELVVTSAPPALDLEPLFDRHARRGLRRGALIESVLAVVARACLERVVLRDAPAFERACEEGPVLFLGNHQVQIESFLAGAILPDLCRRHVTAIADAKHVGAWLGQLTEHFRSHPARPPGPHTTVYFDQSERRSLFDIVDALGKAMRAGETSVLVHVEGRLGRACRAPVTTMSSLFTDLAQAADTPIVPFFFAGGLPLEPLAADRDLSIGLGRQTLYLGTPIAPGELAALPLAERKKRVIDAINDTGPGALEVPAASDPDLERAVHERMAATGAPEVMAFIWELLRRDPAVIATPEGRWVLDAIEGRGEAASDDALGRWLASFAAWLHPRRARSPSGAH